MFGKDEEEDPKACRVQERQLSLPLLLSISPEAEIIDASCVLHNFDTLNHILIKFSMLEEEDQKACYVQD